MVSHLADELPTAAVSIAWPAKGAAHRPPAETSLVLGQQVGRWHVVELIGSGGFGSVYRVTDVEGGAAAALKIMHRQWLEAAGYVARFNREIQSLSSISHRGVVEILDIGVAEDGRPFFVMELLNGESLAALLERRHRLPVQEVAAILDPLCAALDLAHRQDIVHRDLKASNVFLHRLDGGVRPVLLDFGIAKVLGAPGGDLTRSGVTMGTPAAMAPEQICGQAVDARTDVYGLGVLTFQLLAGVLPFGSSDDATRILYLHVHGTRPRVSAYAPVPAGVDQVVARAMAKDPRDRYASASEFARALHHAIAEEAPASRLPEGAAGACLALGLHLTVRLEESVADDPGDEILDDVEAVLALTSRHCQASAFEKLSQTSGSMLWARPLGRDSTEKDAIEQVIALEKILAARPTRNPRVRVTMMMRVDGVVMGQGHIAGGPLAAPASWEANQALAGVLVSGEVSRFFPDDRTEPVDGQRWLRLKGT